MSICYICGKKATQKQAKLPPAPRSLVLTPSTNFKEGSLSCLPNFMQQ